MKLYIYLILLLSIWCQCPNECNGHGKCTLDLSCDCYNQGLSSSESSSPGYTGADCSEFLCPVGAPFSPYGGSVNSLKTSAPAGGNNVVVIPSRRLEERKVNNKSRLLQDEATATTAEATTAEATTPEATTTADGATTSEATSSAPPDSSLKFTYAFMLGGKAVFKVMNSEYSCGSSNIISCELSCTDGKADADANAITTKATILSYNGNEMYVKYEKYGDNEVATDKLDTTITEIQTLTCITPTKGKKDMTKYFEIAVGSVNEKKATVTIAGYYPILNLMGFKMSPSSNSLDILCYHPTENVNGFLYTQTATVTNSGDNILIEVSEKVSTSLAENDICFLMSNKNGENLKLDMNKELKSQCDACSEFEYRNSQLLYKSKIYDGITIDPTGTATATPVPSEYNMIIDSTLTRFIINNYNSKKVIELPPKKEGDDNTKGFYDALRKGAKLTINMIDEEGTVVVAGTFNPVENANIISYDRTSFVVTIDQDIEFSNIKARMLEDKRFKLKITVTKCEKFTPIDSNGIIVYTLPKTYKLDCKSCKVMCGKNKNIIGRVYAVSDTPITYISYNETMCNDPYDKDCDEESERFPLDLECKKIEKSEYTDMTNYRDIDIHHQVQ